MTTTTIEYTIGGSPTIKDVANALGASTYSLKKLFTHTNVNKWSLWKPMKNSKVSDLTLEDIQSSKAGLTLWEMKYNGNSLIAGSMGSIDLAQLTHPEASYDKPIQSNIARLGDFRWYVHNCPPTDSNYKDVYAVADDYDFNCGPEIEGQGTALQKYRTTTEGSNSYDWVPNSGRFMSACSQGLIQCFSFRYSTYTGDVIGSFAGINLVIPLSMFFSYSNSSNRYRLGLIIKVGDSVDLCVSAKTLKENAGRSGGDVIPTLGTNTGLALKLKQYTGSKVDVIPCIVENATINFNTPDNKNHFSYISGFSKIYAMPSGQGVFQLSCRGGSSSSSGDPNTVTTPISWLPTGWSAVKYLDSSKQVVVASRVVYSSQYATSYQYAIFKSSAFPSTTVYAYFKNNSGEAEKITKSLNSSSNFFSGYGAELRVIQTSPSYVTEKGYTGWYVKYGSNAEVKVL